MHTKLLRCIILGTLFSGMLYVLPASAADCNGLQVAADADLVTIAKSAPAGTTFCLASGTYTIGATPVPVQAGDQFIGESRASVFVTTSTAKQVFRGQDATGARLQSMDISGAQGSLNCKLTCGRGIWLKGFNTVLSDLYVHHNEATGAAGMELGGRVENSEFAYNGSSDFVGCCAGGIKVPAQTTITGSYIHHNTGNGVWQDVCGKGLEVRNNTIVWNTRSGVRYEHNQDCTGSAIIWNNVIQNNNTANHNDSAGVRVNSAPNADIGFNAFGGNKRGGVSIGGGRGPVTGTIVHDNQMNGDAIKGCLNTGVTCINNV